MKAAGTFPSPPREVSKNKRRSKDQGKEKKKGCRGQGSPEAPYWFQNATGSWGIGDGGQQHLSNSVGARVVPLEPVIQGTPCCGLDWKARISARWPESPLSPSRWLLCFGRS